MPNINRNDGSANPLDGFLTKTETAEALRVSDRTLDRWHTLRKGPPRTNVGVKVYYAKAAIEEWMRRHTVHPVE